MMSGMRRAEAPFRQSLDRRAVVGDVATKLYPNYVALEKSNKQADQGFASGMFSTARQAGGNCAMVIGGLGFGGTLGGLGCSTESLNQ